MRTEKEKTEKREREKAALRAGLSASGAASRHKGEETHGSIKGGSAAPDYREAAIVR